MSNIYYGEKLTFSKLVRKVKFSKRKLKKCTNFEEQNGTRYIPGKVYFGIMVPQISFNLFCSGDKRLLSKFLRK